jgi:hypothetical protein
MTTRSVLTLLCAAALLLGGCMTFRREAPRPGRTTLDAPLVVVPAVSLGNFLLVETKWDRHGPYRFLVDTGSSATIVTPELARRHRAKNQPPETMPQVRNRAARGGITLMDSGVISRLELGGARFEDVRILIHDCRELSAHLGVRIDGILGFPLFRETVLTLDYSRSRLLLQPRSPAPLVPGVAIPFNNELRTPIIPLQLGEQSISALIDSGSDAPLSLNLAGLAADFAQLPRPGGAVGTLSGDHLQYIGRWRQPLLIGDYSVVEPIVDVTEELTALGGGILRHFTVTFDQERSQVTFHREERGPVVLPPRRSTGLSFTKFPAYWRVVSVVPDSPAHAAGVQGGDLVTRINGEPVAAWDYSRFEQLVESAGEIRYSFLNGTQEKSRTLAVFELVP